MLDHNDVLITMSHTDVRNRGGKDVKSPVDSLLRCTTAGWYQENRKGQGTVLRKTE